MINEDLRSEWHPDNQRAATEVSPGSDYYALWRCSSDDRHVWSARVSARALQDTGCPVCSGRVALPGETDLATVRPDLAVEWSPKNKIPVSAILPYSSFKATWQCQVEPKHEWVAKVSHRTSGESRGCPHCSAQLSSLLPRRPRMAHSMAPEMVRQRETRKSKRWPEGLDRKTVRELRRNSGLPQVDYLWNRFRMTPDEFDRLWDAQGRACLICSKTESEGITLCVDHDHACCPTTQTCGDCVRGILCRACNLALGFLEDDPDRLQRATTYLRQAETQ